MQVKHAHFRDGLLKGLGVGLGIVIAVTIAVAGALFAQTLTTFQRDTVVSAAAMNANFTALQNADTQLNARVAPIGGIIAWHKSITGAPALPAGWVECDGNPITDSESPLNGQNTPNLNSAPNAWNSNGYFLRGSTTSGGTEVDQFQGHRHNRNVFNQSEHDMRPGPLPGGGNALPAPGPAHPGNLHITGDPTTGLNGVPRTGNETRPVAFTVVWIMRIK